MRANTAKGQATAAATPPPPPLLGVVELAQYLGVPVKTVYNWRVERELDRQDDRIAQFRREREAREKREDEARRS